jgi:exonuclease I
VGFTVNFLKRVEFVCDLVVYLFAEREKGMEREEADRRVYTEFFVQKMMWELEMIRELGDAKALEQLNEEYVGWLADRILDAEVLI